jgi:hypothetical protein
MPWIQGWTKSKQSWQMKDLLPDPSPNPGSKYLKTTSSSLLGSKKSSQRRLKNILHWPIQIDETSYRAKRSYWWSQDTPIDSNPLIKRDPFECSMGICTIWRIELTKFGTQSMIARSPQMITYTICLPTPTLKLIKASYTFQRSNKGSLLQLSKGVTSC